LRTEIELKVKLPAQQNWHWTEIKIIQPDLN